MIVRDKEYETRQRGRIKLHRIYSDKGFYLIQNETGEKYSEAIDVEGAPYTYRETEEKIPPSPEEPTLAPTQTTEDESKQEDT